MKKAWIILCVSVLYISNVFAFLTLQEIFEDHSRREHEWKYGEIDRHVSKCAEIDKLGGQPPVTQKNLNVAEEWCKKNIRYNPKKYLEKIPKRDLKIDRDMKSRQDEVMWELGYVCDAIEKAYSQYESLGLSTEKFKKISMIYKGMAESNGWRKLGEYQPSEVQAGYKALNSWLAKLKEMTYEIYTDLYAEKQRVYAKFAVAHPETAQTRVAIQRAKKAEKRADQAERSAQKANRRAMFAESAAAEACRQAEEARRDAANANSRADEADRRAMSRRR